jgi:RHS repeat-associated protein
MTDDLQVTAKAYTYEAFGKIRAESGTGLLFPNRFTYTARESLFDSLGFYYYRARVMDPNVGRFTSEDPLGYDVGGINLYRYTSNNPLILSDPLGLYDADKCHECLQQAFDHFKICLVKAVAVGAGSAIICGAVGSVFPVVGTGFGAVTGGIIGISGAGARCVGIFRLEQVPCLEGPCKK